MTKRKLAGYYGRMIKEAGFFGVRQGGYLTAKQAKTLAKWVMKNQQIVDTIIGGGKKPDK